MKLIPEITVEVQPDIFVFIWGADRIEMETIISFDPNTLKMLDIGKPTNINYGVSIHLFSNDPPCPNVDKAELLNTFMMVVMKKMADKKHVVILRPKVIYKGDESLSNILCGYQRTLLTTAAIAGGARSAKFE